MNAEEVADELYVLAPEDFTAARNARAKEARAAGDRELASQIAALRRPTAVAWLANALAREQPAEIGALLDLGAALRAASETLSGPDLRQLSAQRRAVIAAMVRQAKALALRHGKRVSDDVARGLEETLGAALADADAGEALRRSRLTDGLAPAGFAGAAGGFTGAPAARLRAVPSPVTADAAPDREVNAERARLRQELAAAQQQAEAAADDYAETSEAFDAAQRALTEAEIVLAEVRAELRRAEQAREQAHRDRERAGAAHATSERRTTQAGELVRDFQSRLDALDG